MTRLYDPKTVETVNNTWRALQELRNFHGKRYTLKDLNGYFAEKEGLSKYKVQQMRLGFTRFVAKKLDDNEKGEFLKAYNSGTSLRELGEKYEISRTTAANLV